MERLHVLVACGLIQPRHRQRGSDGNGRGDGQSSKAAVHAAWAAQLIRCVSAHAMLA